MMVLLQMMHVNGHSFARSQCTEGALEKAFHMTELFVVGKILVALEHLRTFGAVIHSQQIVPRFDVFIVFVPDKNVY